MNKIVSIFFSKDRPFQLDAALRSFAMHCGDASSSQLRVLYAASTARFEQLYQQLSGEHPGVKFVREKDFRTDLGALTVGADYLLFLVDDNVFVRSFSLADAICHLQQCASAIGFSLRLGRNTTYCYPLSAPQKLPDFTAVSNGVLSFQWTEAEHDFGFPLEVSSSVYRANQFIDAVLAADSVTNPNKLESRMHDLRTRFMQTHPLLLCFETSVTFCNPVNVVQNVSANRHSADLEMTAARLAERFELGYRADFAAFKDFVPNGCHAEVEFKFLPPKIDWKAIKALINVSEDANAPDVVAMVEKEKLTDEQLWAVLRLLSVLKRASADDNWFVRLSQLLEEEQRGLTHEFSKTLPRLFSRLGELEQALRWFQEQSGRWEKTALDFKREAEHWRSEAEKLRK